MGLFGRPWAPPKYSFGFSFFLGHFPAELKSFHKMFGKTASSTVALSELHSLAPPPKWKPQTAPGAAHSLELLDLRALGRTLAGVGFEALPNMLKVAKLAS
jgi:hypothetical protein